MIRSLLHRSVVSTLAIAAVMLSTVTPLFSVAAQAKQDANPAPSGWQARLSGHESAPPLLVAVDKNHQTLFLFEQHSPLRLAQKYACTTGQNEGDKILQGDLKTPEGVYFVIRKLTEGLNFEKYGNEAYTLNYPNPVDKLRKKTGYGIWIHGRGVPITPKVTEGCVSLNNKDIAALGKGLTPGTPVALAQTVTFSPKALPSDKAVIDSLNKKTFEWAKAWAGRSKKLFDYYDPEAYTIAQEESFSAFRQQKERVFKAVSYIDIKLSNVQTLQGPGYWVTWFQQDYKASNLSTKGVRRLYWQKDTKGEPRIVGMEWAPHLSGTLTAGLNDAPITVAEKITPSSMGKPAAATVASATPPKTPPPVSALAKPAPIVKQPTPVAAKSSQPAVVAVAAPPPVVKQTAKTPNVSVFIELWRKSWEKGDLNAYAAYYDKNALQGKRTGSAAIKSHKRGLWKKSSPKQVVLTNIRITSTQGVVTANMQQTYTDSNSFADMGIKTLHLHLKNNAWRITREDWSPMQQ